MRQFHMFLDWITDWFEHFSVEFCTKRTFTILGNEQKLNMTILKWQQNPEFTGFMLGQQAPVAGELKTEWDDLCLDYNYGNGNVCSARKRWVAAVFMIAWGIWSTSHSSN